MVLVTVTRLSEKKVPHEMHRVNKFLNLPAFLMLAKCESARVEAWAALIVGGNSQDIQFRSG